MHVAITGLLKITWRRRPLFYKHVFMATIAACQNSGNLKIRFYKRKGVLFTMTAWKSEEDMKRFVMHPHHIAAMKALPRIGNGKVHSYQTDVMPTWNEAIKIWDEHGREYGNTEHGPKS